MEDCKDVEKLLLPCDLDFPFDVVQARHSCMKQNFFLQCIVLFLPLLDHLRWANKNGPNEVEICITHCKYEKRITKTMIFQISHFLL